MNDLADVPLEHRSAVSARIEAFKRYETHVPTEKGGKAKFADRLAASLGVNRSQFYRLLRIWRESGDPTRLSNKRGVARGKTHGRTTPLSERARQVMSDEIRKANDEDTDVDIHRRIQEILSDDRAPSLPTIARSRRWKDDRPVGERLDQVVAHALTLAEALHGGVANLSPRHAQRAATHVGRHLGARVVTIDVDEVAIHGMASIQSRLTKTDDHRETLLLVTGVKTARDKRISEIRTNMRNGDHMVMSR